MKTIRQRKDELVQSIKNKMDTEFEHPAPFPHGVDASQFYQYKKIIMANGFKNERVIDAQLVRFLALDSAKTAIYSNLKFMNLFRSRLNESGIPFADCEKILQYVVFNLAEVNEDDDYIGDAALHYAELCKKHYDGFVNNSSPISPAGLTDQQAQSFNLVSVELPPA